MSQLPELYNTVSGYLVLGAAMKYFNNRLEEGISEEGEEEEEEATGKEETVICKSLLKYKVM